MRKKETEDIEECNQYESEKRLGDATDRLIYLTDYKMDRLSTEEQIGVVTASALVSIAHSLALIANRTPALQHGKPYTDPVNLKNTRSFVNAIQTTESAILGACLLDNGCLREALETHRLAVEDFSLPGNRLIYNTMIELALQNQPVDEVTLVNELQRYDMLDVAGGPLRIAELVETVPTAQNFKAYVKQLKEMKKS